MDGIGQAEDGDGTETGATMKGEDMGREEAEAMSMEMEEARKLPILDRCIKARQTGRIMEEQSTMEALAAGLAMENRATVEALRKEGPMAEEATEAADIKDKAGLWSRLRETY